MVKGSWMLMLPSWLLWLRGLEFFFSFLFFSSFSFSFSFSFFFYGFLIFPCYYFQRSIPEGGREGEERKKTHTKEQNTEENTKEEEKHINGIQCCKYQSKWPFPPE